MRTKQFKSESKKLMDMMINSIYTHKEIFLRELISNASDALDKLYFRSLTDNSVGIAPDDFEIRLEIDKDARTLKIIDNGCGMTEDELDKNLGTIAKSGSFDFKQNNEKKENVDIIGQFGVGFYSAFMVSDKVTVESKAFGSDEAFCWTSKGTEGYTIVPCEKETVGTTITLHIKDKTDDENYDEYLDQYRISSLVKKYSDYIRHPIRMEFTTKEPVESDDKDKAPEYRDVTELRTLNSMIPLWKKAKNEISAEDYNSFYKDKFYDYEDPARVIHTKTEGQATYSALMFIPKHPPFDYYTKEFEKGLQLYSKGVLIMDKCSDLLPDYFSFVKGLVDSEDLSLNISRETLQHDGQLKLIAKTLEKKIKSELEKMLKDEREAYEEFFKSFGIQLKFGVYNDYGMHKDTLKDLLLFRSSNEKKYVTFKEYTERMKEGQDTIYYACGETDEKIEMLPQTDAVKDKGYEILYLTENVDEFALKMLGEYDGKKFMNICDDNLNLDSEDEKKALEEENAAAKDMFDAMKESIGDSISAVRFTNKLKNHPVCLTSEGGISLEMEKVLNSMPNAEQNKVQAKLVLEINAEHPIAEKLKSLYNEDKEMLGKYVKLLYGEACLIGGKSVLDPAEHSALVCELMTK
ncbi:MAG: molecular chaperone HtpG [Acutalibacteraceae bacterium]|nr:molecular chaperone HtpG [Acutalibacteraceae bacterium]